MTDNEQILKKLKKQTLPSGWIEQFSKKYPDKPFYFNEKTGESRWSPPLKSQKMVMELEKKSKKRKFSDKESEEFSSAGSSIINNSTNASTHKRVKLKPKVSKPVQSDKKQPENDTPAMRLYREKMSQRKAALEAKKNAPKTSKQNQNKVLTPPKIVSQVTSSSFITQTQRRRRRTFSSISSIETVNSNSSNIANVSVIDSKVKNILTPVKTLSRATKSFVQTTGNKLPKDLSYKTSLVSEQLNSSSCNTSDDINMTNESLTDHNTTTLNTKKSLQKNLANERMENYRRSNKLNHEKDKGSPAKRFHGVSNNNNKVNNSSVDKKNRVRSSGLLEINKNNQEVINEEENVKNKRILDKIEVTDIHCEQMEWEPIEDEKITSEVYSVRFQLCEKPMGKLNEFPCNALRSLDTSGEKHALYIIIDTNVLLSNLPFIEEIRDSYSDIFGRPFIVIPWTVLQELDFIKDNKNHTRSQALKLKARRAVEFLNRHFTAKHPRFLGQTSMDVEKNKKKFIIECPDDEILQTCLQIKESSKSPVLLSYDKNLCNKAMVHDIPILGRNDPLEKIYYLKAAETTEFFSNNLHAQVDEIQEDISIVQKELLAADDIMENGKAVLKVVLSEVVAKEMENLFGKRWEMHVIIRPPWSIAAVLKCTLKHWMAAISESFTRRTEPMLRDLLHCISEVPDGGRKLQDVKFFLDKCNDVIQTLNDAKYPILKPQILTKIDELRKTCLSNIEELKLERFKESVGSEEDADEEERRALLAFKVFEEIYAFARDTCGLSAETMGLPCTFSYNKLHPFLTTEIALQQQRDVGVNVNKLLQVLRTSLSKLNDGTGLDDKIILALYEVLVNFSSDLSFDELSRVTPLDVYCCMKLKKSTLEKGYEQLQELAIHFCRMANYQSF